MAAGNWVAKNKKVLLVVGALLILGLLALYVKKQRDATEAKARADAEYAAQKARDAAMAQAAAMTQQVEVAPDEEEEEDDDTVDEGSGTMQDWEREFGPDKLQFKDGSPTPYFAGPF